MPFYSTSEMAKTYQIPSEVVYCLAGRLPGFFPDLKAKIGGKGNSPFLGQCSLYSEYKMHLLGETLRQAPGDSLDDKIKHIQQGFELSRKEKDMILQNLSPQQTSSLLNQVKQIWDFCCGNLSSGGVTDLQAAASSRIRSCRKHYEDLDVDKNNAFKLIKAHLDYVYEKRQCLEILRKVDMLDSVRSFDADLADRLHKNRKLWLSVRDQLVRDKLISTAGPSGWYKIHPNYQKGSTCAASSESLQSAS